MLERLDEIERDALAGLSGANDPDALEAWRIEFLGTKGRLKAAAGLIKDVPKEHKPAFGKRLNEVKRAVEKFFGVKVIDVRTLNVHGKPKRLGRHMGRRKDWKKAVVTLQSGEKIDLFDTV